MAETALAIRNDVQLQAFEPSNLMQAMDLASKLVKSDLMPRHLRKAEDVLLVIMTGREMGLSVMQSIRGMHVIEGKVSLSADLIVALVKRHPDCEFFRMVKSSDEEAIYETRRRGDPEATRLTYTIKQAQSAGLTGKDNWKKHTAAMLRARCSAALARVVYPDGALGIYDTDEAEEIAARGTWRRSEPPPASTVTVEGEVLESKLQESVGQETHKLFERLMCGLLDARTMGAMDEAMAAVAQAKEQLGKEQLAELRKAAKEARKSLEKTIEAAT